MCPNCEVLAGEVQALKRALAGRVAPVTFTGLVAPSGTLTITTACIHDAVYGVCRKLGCRLK